MTDQVVISTVVIVELFRTLEHVQRELESLNLGRLERLDVAKRTLYGYAPDECDLVGNSSA